MKEWFARLEPRERVTLSLGGGIAVIVLLYAILWLPVERDLTDLRATVESRRATAQWMKASAVEVMALRGVKSGGGRGNGRPLLTLVEQTAKRAGLGSALNRVEPQGSDRARVWLESASFDMMVGWLAQIQRDHGIQAERAVVDPQEKAGRLNSRLVLRRGGGA